MALLCKGHPDEVKVWYTESIMVSLSEGLRGEIEMLVIPCGKQTLKKKKPINVIAVFFIIVNL